MHSSVVCIYLCHVNSHLLIESLVLKFIAVNFLFIETKNEVVKPND